LGGDVGTSQIKSWQNKDFAEKLKLKKFLKEKSILKASPRYSSLDLLFFSASISISDSNSILANFSKSAEFEFKDTKFSAMNKPIKNVDKILDFFMSPKLNNLKK
jgi:hypothetical protein